jgi:NADPH:quinone reductase
MKALLVENFTSVESLRLSDTPSPAIERGHARIRVKAAGIGFVEALKIAGHYQTRDPLPFVPGTEFAGIVEEVGDGSTELKVGKRVFGHTARGALAEEICVPAGELSRIPDRLSFAEAAAVPVNYLTAAYGLIKLADLRAGQNLLVLGAAGGTGTAAIKIGRMVGAHVIAAAASEEKRAFARRQGADQVVDYTAEDWRKTLTSMTGGKPMNVIFDAVGGDISPIAFRTLGWRGRHLVVGFAAGSIPALPMNIALLKGASLVGVDSAQIRRWEPEVHDRLTKDIAMWLETGTVEPPPITKFPFEEFQRAFDAIRSRQAVGKIVVEMSVEAGAPRYRGDR